MTLGKSPCTAVVEIPIRVHAGANGQAVLRLRKNFASQSSSSAQDDGGKGVGLGTSEDGPDTKLIATTELQSSRYLL